jgi:D-alanine--poly(phosphoribitol) ligase subunit 2
MTAPTTKHAIEASVMDVLKSLRPDSTKDIKPDTDLFAAGVLDSFGVIEYISALEEKFAIKISNDDLLPQNLFTAAATAKTVENYLK